LTRYKCSGNCVESKVEGPAERRQEYNDLSKAGKLTLRLGVGGGKKGKNGFKVID